MQLVFLLRKITQRLYPYRGWSRIADLVRKAYMHGSRRYLIRDFDGDLSFDCALDEHISSQIFWRGSYSTDQLCVLRRLLKPGMVFVDAGANKGEFTLLAAKYTPGGKVLAFEPVESNFEELRANVAANGFPHVQLIRKGLGKVSGERVLYHMKEEDGRELNLGTFTLYPRAGLDCPYGSIGVVTLDDFVQEEGIGRVDVMKIDIEGGELEMLEGAEETIRRWKPVILIEVNAFTSIAAGYDHRAILRLLHGWGYRCDLIGRKGRTRPVGEKGLGKFQNLVCRPVESTATIAFILPDLRGGGAEKSVCTLLNELCRREVRMEIDLVLVKAAGVFLKDVPGRVGVVDLGRERAVFALLPLVRYLRENRPRVLVAHLSHINLLAAMAIRLAGTNTRLVVVEHGILSPVRSFLRKEWWVQWGMKKCYPSAAAIVAVSKNAARDIALHLGLPEEKIRNIYNPVVTGELLRQAEMSLSHPWFGKKEAPVILGAGRLVKEKDFVTLIAAVAEVRKRRPVRLVILGEGEEREALESLVLRLGMQEVVWMPGFVDNPYAYMASSDVFVLSSRREGLGNVLIEAMACGCPVIATDCPGGPREILEDGAFGVLVPVGNVAALAGAILRVPEAPVGKERMAERAAFFSGKRAADAWLSLISELISPIEPVPGEKAVPGEKPVPGEKKVVLHVITGLRTGGAERMLCQLLSAIDRQRWEPVVVSLTDGGQPEAWLRERGIPVYNLGWRPGRLPSPGGCLQLIRLVRRIRPALIHGWMYHANLAAQLAGIFSWRGLPVIWSIHHSIGGLAVEKGGLAVEKKTTAGTIRLGAKLSRLPDKIVYASQVSRTQHISLGYSDRKGCLIPYGIDVDMFVARPGAKESVRKELGWPVGGLLIGSLARYHPMKDHENFLRAAALLCGRPEGREVQFMLAGAHVDPGNTELRVLVHELGIGDRVQLLGERADSARVLSAMDIFTVSSSHGEALPMVLLEAMSCGIPCVTTDVGDAGIAVGDTGRVVAPRDAEGLAEAWSELIVAGGAKRTALGEMARQRVLNHYTLTVCARAYEELYGSLRG